MISADACPVAPPDLVEHHGLMIYRDIAVREPIRHEHVGRTREQLERRDLATSRILLVGEDNPQSSRIDHVLYPHPSGCAGHRLQELILQLPEYVYMGCWRANLCTGAWDRRQAGVRVLQLIQDETPWSGIIMLGRKVAQSFACLFGDLDPFESLTYSRDGHVSKSINVVSLPHPSGRCREWNDPGNFARVKRVMSTVSPELWPS